MKAIIVAVSMAALAAFSLAQAEDAEQRERDARAELADALFEVERLDAKLNTCMEIKRQLRAGEID